MKKIIISFTILYFKNDKECINNVIYIMEKGFVKKYIPIKNLKTKYVDFEKTGYYFYKDNKIYRALFYIKELK